MLILRQTVESRLQAITQAIELVGYRVHAVNFSGLKFRVVPFELTAHGEGTGAHRAARVNGHLWHKTEQNIFVNPERE
jgi:hypothetical protein